MDPKNVYYQLPEFVADRIYSPYDVIMANGHRFSFKTSTKKPMKTHRTKEGEYMLIASMTDQHLLNTITAMGKAIKTLMVIKPKNLLDRALYSREDISEEDRLEKIREIDGNLGHYVLEASIRGMDLKELLQKIYGRQNAIPEDQILIDVATSKEEEINIEDIPF